MRAVPVVVVKPGKKMLQALLRVLIGAGVSPFAKSSLDEAFGFSISARGVRTGEVMTQTQLQHGGAEGAGAVTVTVVGEQATNGDAQGGVKSDRGAQEGNGASGIKAGQDLGEGNP